MATITACRGRAGARRNSTIRARRCSTTPRSRWPRVGSLSAPASASSAMARTCWRRAPIPRTPSSRTAIRNSPWRCSRSSAGTRISPTRRSRPSTRSPATRPTGRPTFPAASSASPSSTAARRSATPRRARWCGPSRIRSRCTANRSTRRGAICCRNMRPIPTARLGACRRSMPRSRRTTTPSSSRPF